MTTASPSCRRRRVGGCFGSDFDFSFGGGGNSSGSGRRRRCSSLPNKKKNRSSSSSTVSSRWSSSSSSSFLQKRRQQQPPTVLFLLHAVIAGCFLIDPAAAIMQTGAMDVYLQSPSSLQRLQQQQPPPPSYTMLVSQASFGGVPPMDGGGSSEQIPFRRLIQPPARNPLLCENVTAADIATTTTDADPATKTIVMVPRGVCTFETKAWHAQQLGADAVLVYGSLASRYSVNRTAGRGSDSNGQQQRYTASDLLYPENLVDYDCARGAAAVPADAVTPLNPNAAESVYDAARNDPVLSGATAENLCFQNSPDKLAACPGASCLLTGKETNESSGALTGMMTSSSSQYLEACCAWDLPIWLFGDGKHGAAVTIPASYATVEQARRLLSDVSEHDAVTVRLYSRWRSPYNWSSGLIWMLGVAVAAGAAYLSAADYHDVINRVIQKRERAAAAAQAGGAGGGISQQQQHRHRRRRPAGLHPEDSMELTAAHALGFVVLASCSLLVLFYLKIYATVKVLYAVGCSKAVQVILLQPATQYCRRKCFRHVVKDAVLWRTGTEDFGDITVTDVVSTVLAFSWGLAWIVTAFCVRRPEGVAFFWVTQNIFGACMCAMFLQVIKLNGMRVASILLIVAFLYDIFFVFVSPLLFDKSVMITVATSGGPPAADPAWCEKYPDGPECQGGQPLPMLLTIPRFEDYQGGQSLLGLGDIVLPGLLLSFCARLDAAKCLLGLLNGGHTRQRSYVAPLGVGVNGGEGCSALAGDRQHHYFCCFGRSVCCRGGYFFPAAIAYAVGLCLANAAVYAMNTGQPALLYLVPACLGTVVVMAWRRGELPDLWHGPVLLKTADRIVYGPDDEHGEDGQGGEGIGEDDAMMVGGGRNVMTRHEIIPQEEGLEAPMVPSAVSASSSHDGTDGGNN